MFSILFYAHFLNNMVMCLGYGRENLDIQTGLSFPCTLEQREEVSTLHKSCEKMSKYDRAEQK